MENGSSNVHVTSYVKMLNFDFPVHYLVILYILCIHPGLFICAIKKSGFISSFWPFSIHSDVFIYVGQCWCLSNSSSCYLVCHL